jgi:hypothetical protein
MINIFLQVRILKEPMMMMMMIFLQVENLKASIKMMNILEFNYVSSDNSDDCYYFPGEFDIAPNEEDIPASKDDDILINKLKTILRSKVASATGTKN